MKFNCGGVGVRQWRARRLAVRSGGATFSLTVFGVYRPTDTERVEQWKTETCYIELDKDPFVSTR